MPTFFAPDFSVWAGLIWVGSSSAVLDRGLLCGCIQLLGRLGTRHSSHVRMAETPALHVVGELLSLHGDAACFLQQGSWAFDMVAQSS